jgi:hypothetical protein
MGEEDMVGLIVKACPFYGSPCLLKHPYLLFLWALSDGFFMASQADFNLRKARKGLLFHVLMTRDTLHALVLMGLMVKLDGLLHPSSHDRGEKEDSYQDYQEEKDDTPQKKPTPFSLDHGRNWSHSSFTFFRMASLTTPSFLAR